jgi:nucleotide-binding universal stress UspA family protein
MILICYDQSSDSRQALEQAARLFSHEPATVLTVWQPFGELRVRIPLAVGGVPSFGGVPLNRNVRELDEESRKQADETAAEGAELARQLGMTARPRSVARATTIGRTILAEAEALGASAIVMGSRGRTAVRSLLLGSVVHDVAQHADRTVVVVPSEKVAASRARAAREEPAT